nr:MAG TPA: hypothetical protein [Caudoviricetes sp.]
MRLYCLMMLYQATYPPPSNKQVSCCFKYYYKFLVLSISF